MMGELDLGWAAFGIVLVVLIVPILVVLASAVNTCMVNRNLHRERKAMIERGEPLENVTRLYEAAIRPPSHPWTSKTSALEFGATAMGIGLGLLSGAAIIHAMLGPDAAWKPILLVGGVVCLFAGSASSAATLWLRRHEPLDPGKPPHTMDPP